MGFRVNALQSNQLHNAKFYILCNANIYQLNNDNIDPKTINPFFIDNILDIKDKIHNNYKKTIISKVNTNHYLYEKYIINEINEFIDIRPDIYNFLLTKS